MSEEKTSITKDALDFVFQCYFGNMEDPIEAAIDRAYVDMASHTLRGFADNYKAKWEARYNASKKIEEYLYTLEESSIDYDEWHKNLCKELIEVYKDKPGDEFSYGQAQKWVNMTMKYLWVFALLLSKMDEGNRKHLKDFLLENVDKLHISLDSYVLDGYKVDTGIRWSKMEEDDYLNCRNKLKDKSLKDELKDWPRFANNINPEKNSYDEYKHLKKIKG